MSHLEFAFLQVRQKFKAASVRGMAAKMECSTTLGHLADHLEPFLTQFEKLNFGSKFFGQNFSKSQKSQKSRGWHIFWGLLCAQKPSSTEEYLSNN